MIQILFELDEELARWGNQTTRRSRGLCTAAAAMAVAGSWVAAGLLSMFWLQAWLQARPSHRRAAERAFVSVGFTYLAVEAVGRMLPRVRPFASAPRTLGLVSHTEQRSFPSRHVASAFAMATVISPSSRRLAACLRAIGALLGCARIAAGVHYPSDVLAGIALGTGIGRAIRRSAEVGVLPNANRSTLCARAARAGTLGRGRC